MPKKCATSATRRRMTSCGTPRFSSPNANSCHTVSHTSWFSGLWATYPMPAAESPTDQASRDVPKTRSMPARSPAGAISGFSERRSVVLPLPVAPTISRNAPAGTCQSSPWNTGVPPGYENASPRASTASPLAAAFVEAASAATSVASSSATAS